MTTATNKKSARKSNKKARNAVKRGAIAGNAQVKSETVVQPEVQMTAAARIAAMGDNIRPFYTAVDDLVTDFIKASGTLEAKITNTSLDWTLRMFDMREHVSLEYFVLGNKTVKPDGARTDWLYSNVPHYADAVDAGKAVVQQKDHPDFYKYNQLVEARDTAKAAADRIRVMFERVCHAAFYLEHLEAKEIGTAKKGKSRAITFQYQADDKDKDGNTVKKWFPATNSITQLVSNARAVVASKNANAGKKPTAQSAKRGKKNATTPAVKEGQSVLDTAENLSTELRTKIKGEKLTEAATSPQMEGLMAATIAARFGSRNKQGNVTMIDLVALVTWLKASNYFQNIKFIGEVVKPEPEDKKNGNKSEVPAATAA